MVKSATDAKEVRLVPVTRDNWRASLALGVHPEQQRFVADYAPISALVLAKAYVGAGNQVWTPFLVEVDGLFVGFVALATDVSPEAPVECWVRHFFIDREQQAKAYGRAAIRALIVEVRDQYAGCNTVYLTVHPENSTAQRLYRSVGFVPTGAEQDGEPVYALAVGGRGG